MLAVGDGEITGQDLRHAEFIEGADLLIHDAQYTAQEYPEKIGWGHSPAEYVIKLARYAGVKRVALTHHDPLRNDGDIEALIACLRPKASAVDVFAAFEGQVVELTASPERIAGPREASRADRSVEPTPAPRAVLLGLADMSTSAPLYEALRAESICIQSYSNISEMLTAVTKDGPSLAIIEHDPPRIDGIAMCRAIRREAKQDRLPVIIIAAEEDQPAGAAAGVSDWMIKPFTAAYARTKIRTWLLRTASKAQKGSVLRGEKQRLSPLRSIGSENIENLHPSKSARDKKRAISLEKSALLWMYGREIASFDTPSFSKKLGEIIARTASMPSDGSPR
jgi:DNA-binding response OmpR family regulator